MKTKFLIFHFLIFASLCSAQKRIDYSRQIHCEKVTNNRADGEIYSVIYNSQKGNAYHFKMDEFQNGLLQISEFDWHDENESKGVSYSINHEENEESFGMNWYFVDPSTSFIYSFSLDVFNEELGIDSRATIECDKEGSQFEREFEITPALVKQTEKFVKHHLADTTPFDFEFPIFDLSVLNQPIYAWHSSVEEFENNIKIQYNIDSIFEKGTYIIDFDSSYVWDKIQDDKVLHHFQHGKQLQIWEGEFHAKSKYARIILTSNLKDTTYKIEYSRNKHNEKPYHDIEVTHYLTEHTDSIDIQKRYIHIEYDKYQIPIYREMKAVTFDGQEVYSIWGKKLKEDQIISQLYVKDAEGKSHYIEIYPPNIQLATYTVPLTRKKYRPRRMSSRKRNRKTLKNIKQEYKLVEKTRGHKIFISDRGGNFLIKEVFYE
ncbi:MAG: hypothetical protein BM555_06185 [Crocinitomix sp. MedPE-SWsnd]|nr:MAG: hypothetical protein BM555_06185 [Crocinitomix sp. MedPE-SWsnd]